MQQSPSLSSYAQTVRAHDPDRWLASLFAPAPLRADWCVLFAFNHEIAIIAETVSEEMIAHIRYAWWRELLDEACAGTPPRPHPLAAPIAHLIHRHALPRTLFDRLLDAREHAFHSEPPQDPESLALYCRDTSGALMQLCAACAGEADGDAALTLGVDWGLIGTARAMRANGAPLGYETQLLDQVESRKRAFASLPTHWQGFARILNFYDRNLRRKNPAIKTSDRIRLVAALWFGSVFASN